MGVSNEWIDQEKKRAIRAGMLFSVEYLRGSMLSIESDVAPTVFIAPTEKERAKLMARIEAARA